MVEGARQRSRVGSPMQASSSAGSLTAPAGHVQDACSLASRAKLQTLLLQQQVLPVQVTQQTSPRVAAGMQFRQDPAPYSKTPPAPLAGSAAAATVPVALSSQAVLDPPAPRCWTPSKLSHGAAGGGGGSSAGGASASGSTPRCMTPAEALEQEMQELCCVDPGSLASALVHQRAQSCTASGAGGPKAAYTQQEAVNGGVRRPASSGQPSPYAAQHNNLVAPSLQGGGSRPHSNSSSNGTARDDSWSSQLGLIRLREMKDRLAGLGSETHSTAVEEFHEPAAGGVVVARRRGTAPARLLPSNGYQCSQTTAQWEQECAALLSAGDRLAALQLPGPSNGVVKCYIKRTSNLLGLAPLFELRLESSDELLAVARRRVKGAASCYDISLACTGGGSSGSGCSTPSSGPSMNGGSAVSVPASAHKDGPPLVGKLKANMLGTEYLLRGRGGDQATHKGFNAQLLAVTYTPTVNHIQAAARTMTAVLPVPGSQVWGGSQQAPGLFDSLPACIEAAQARQLPMSYERDLVMLHNMKPHFDAVKQVHYLDFKGRVKEVSLKNFQLVHWDHNRNQLGTDLVLLFGKKGHGEYATDFCYPMTPLQAFALGLSSIDSKLCYAL